MDSRVADLVRLVVERGDRSANDLDALSKASGFSRRYLHQLFERYTGESARQLFARIALTRAASDLVGGDRSVLEIALDSGYESHEGFTRAFSRRYGMSPSEYRARGLSPGDAELHRETTVQVGPCLTLYRVGSIRRSDAPAKEECMKYELEERSRDAIHSLVKRRRVAHDGMSDALGEILPAVFEYAVKNGVAIVGQPFCRYLDWSPSGVTVEAGLPIAAAHEGSGDIVSLEIPAGPALSTVHVGPYDTLDQAYAAVEAWVVEHARTTSAPAMEIYVTDPGEVPDPSQWQTEVVQPLEP